MMLTDAEIIARYKEGASLREIAGELGASTRRPQRVIQQAGITRPTHGHAFHKQWRGGRTMHDGYVRVMVPDDHPMASMRNCQGYVLEHRLVMATALGRPLVENETVHHIDGVKTNNGIGNLQLRIGPHGKHSAYRCANCGSHNVVPAPLRDPT